MAKAPRGGRQTAVSARSPRGVQAPQPPVVPAGVTVQQVQQQGTIETRTYASPLMAPADIERLDRLLEGGAQQYFDWMKEQSTHRQQLERRALEAQIASERRGQLCGLGIALVSVVFAFIVGIRGGHDNLAIAFISAPLVAIVGVFVTGRLITRNENVAKTKILAGSAPQQ
jgi:uncharacterized membrane protein